MRQMLQMPKTRHFIILTHPRTGSNLLVHALRHAVGIHCYGEILARDYPDLETLLHRLSELAGVDYNTLKTKHENDVVNFIYEVVFAFGCTQAIGFKLFYQHAREPARERIWDALRADQSLSVIHLTRNGLLNLLLSYIYARKTNVWLVRNDSSQNSSAIVHNDLENVRIEPVECRRFFEHYELMRDRARVDFQQHAYYELDYAELSDNLLWSVNNILSFLDLPKLEVLSEPLHKQATRKASEKVSNFDELREYFVNTKWSSEFSVPGE